VFDLTGPIIRSRLEPDVVKPTRANGRGLVKLSDNPAKAVGQPDDIARYKRAAAYRDREAAELKY
jgi:hypothetical protein